MRNTWLGNGNKAFPWDQTSLFSQTPPAVKKSLDSKYSSEWRGMLLVSSTEKRSKSPLDHERHGSLSQRTMEPDLQDMKKESGGKRQLKCPKPNKIPLSTKAKHIQQGNILQKNSPSPLNPLLSPNLDNMYSSSQIIISEHRSSSRKRPVLPQEQKSIEKKPSKFVKPDFISQIKGLPGTLITEVSVPKPSLESYKARGILESSDSGIEKPSRQQSTGKEQWRSSFDFLKHVITNKTYY